MAITTTLATRYWLKTLIMAIVCLVLGVWGAWDYWVAIPAQQLGFDRAEVLRTAKAGLESSSGSDAHRQAVDSVAAALAGEGDDAWTAVLSQIQGALAGGDFASTQAATGHVQDGLNRWGSVTPPGKYDRPVQIMFILCFPFGIWYLRSLSVHRNRAQGYRLDDDGTLNWPGGSASESEIASIDMDRWSCPTGNARSTWVAKVETADGQRVVLDDYLYTGMHLVIGAIAHRLHPDEWTVEAKRVSAGDDEDQ